MPGKIYWPNLSVAYALRKQVKLGFTRACRGKRKQGTYKWLKNNLVKYCSAKKNNKKRFKKTSPQVIIFKIQRKTLGYQFF